MITLTGPHLPRPFPGEKITDVYKQVIWDKYNVRVRESELGIVHRFGQGGCKIIAEHLQRTERSAFQRILAQRGGGNRAIKVII